MAEPSDDVSGIHGRYTLTLFTPSSHYVSLAASLAVACCIVAVVHVGYLGAPATIGSLLGDAGPPAVLVAAFLAASQAADARLIKRREYSKALHMSLFGNLAWLLVCLAGLAAPAVLAAAGAGTGGGAGPPHIVFVALGAFVFASFRYGILTTTLGAGEARAGTLCLVQPVGVFAAMSWLAASASAAGWGGAGIAGTDAAALWMSHLYDPLAAGFGASFLAISVVWSRLTDRAGRPGVHSTHHLIQAYLSSRASDYDEIERIIERRSQPSDVSTAQLRLRADAPPGAGTAAASAAGAGGPWDGAGADGQGSAPRDVRLVLPDIHPGPYHPIGGSNIPYLIYERLGSSAMVMHSISDHALNLPSRGQVEAYLGGLLDGAAPSGGGTTCTEPVSVQINRARVVGLLFGRVPLLLLSLSPHGMEDLPSSMKADIERFASGRGFGRPMVVDCHNAMGDEISAPDYEDMLKAARSCLDALLARDAHRLEFGYANSSSMGVSGPDLGLGSLGMLCLRLGGRRHFVGWADANNMENGVREHVVDRLADAGYDLLEVCTSDTHYSRTTVRTRQGYYQFGIVTDRDRIADWFLELARRSEAAVRPAAFEVLEARTRVRVMGPQIFEDYKRALDRSLALSKAFAAGAAALFLGALAAGVLLS